MFVINEDTCEVSDVVTGDVYNDCMKGFFLLEIKTRVFIFQFQKILN